MSNLSETLQCRVQEVVARPDGKQDWRCLDANNREVWVRGVDAAHPEIRLSEGEAITWKATELSVGEQAS